MCDSYHTQAQPAWAFSDDYSFSRPPQPQPRRMFTATHLDMPPMPARRGAVVAYACVQDEVSQLEQLRRGSISTAFRGLQIDRRQNYQQYMSASSLPVPPVVVCKPAPAISTAENSSYYQSIPSPPSSPRSAPASPLSKSTASAGEYAFGDRGLEVPEMDFFQRRVLERLHALNSESSLLPPPSSSGLNEEDKLTPPPSPPPFAPAELPTSSPSISSRRGVSKSPLKSSKKASSRSTVSTPLASPTASRTKTSNGRRVSVPAEMKSSGHTSSRGAIKKASSACNSRRGSSKGLEVLLEGTMFKKGWSWETA
ncbi:hypothetical protein DFH27DRAFT_526142 [Peziza echinospora]|nr:hypothetical protein DFH27DRAFT_526142 [Peziza echinospora]